MIDNEFLRCKTYLRGKLSDYLQHKGITAGMHFRCVNPGHHDPAGMMSFVPQENVVRCAGCGAAYDIFGLIGLEYGLTDFKDQFVRTHEMYIGPVSASIADALGVRQESGITPRFEVAGAFPQARADDGGQPVAAAAQPGMESAGTQPAWYGSGQSSDSTAGALRYPGMQGHGVVFGGGSAQFPQGPASGFEPAGDRPQSPLMMPERQMPADGAVYDVRDYLARCRARAGMTDYFSKRGISPETVERFGLGYDDSFVITHDSGVREIWKAAIIPLGEQSFSARNTDPQAVPRARLKKKGPVAFFNANALSRPGRIFITEGEFDALSLETLGYTAVALGGTGTVRYLLELIRSLRPVPDRVFYLALDNDEPGQEAERELETGLRQAGCTCRRVNLSAQYKDINEALCGDRKALQDRLGRLDELLAYAVLELPPARSAAYRAYIEKAEDFNEIGQAAGQLYAVTALPQAHLKLCASLIAARASEIIYAGSKERWQMVADLVPRRSDGQDFISAGCLELKDEIMPDLARGIAALALQRHSGFVMVVDLCTLPALRAREELAALAAWCAGAGIAILALCPDDPAVRQAADLCHQHLQMSFTDKGDLRFTTVLADGRSLSFTRFCTL